MTTTADAAVTADTTLPADGRLLVVTPGYTVTGSRLFRIARALRAWLVSA